MIPPHPSLPLHVMWWERCSTGRAGFHVEVENEHQDKEGVVLVLFIKLVFCRKGRGRDHTNKEAHWRKSWKIVIKQILHQHCKVSIYTSGSGTRPSRTSVAPPPTTPPSGLSVKQDDGTKKLTPWVWINQWQFILYMKPGIKSSL